MTSFKNLIKLSLFAIAIIAAISTAKSQTGFKTHTQLEWGSEDNNSNCGTYRNSHFNSAFPNGLTVGCSTGKKIKFTSSSSIQSFLPCSGNSHTFNQSLTNPTSTSAGEVAGHMVSLILSVGFDNNDQNFCSSNKHLGNREINMPSSRFHGKTINEFISIANEVLGGCSSYYTPTEVNDCASQINENYNNGDHNDDDEEEHNHESTDYDRCHDPIPPVLSFVKVNNLCNDGTNGSITLTVTGGSTPFTYLWSNNATTKDIANLATGNYYVIVTDSRETEATLTVTITAPPPIVITETHTNVLCFGIGSGSVTLSVSGGTSPYTWSQNGVSFQSSSTFSGLAIGNYTFTCKDSKGCIKTKSVTISQPTTALSATVSSQTKLNCYGASNGTASFSVSGGTSPYTYLWSNNSTSSSISNLSAGTYSVTITDANQCKLSKSVTITQPSAALSSTISSQTNASYYGASNGAATLSVSGGTSPYTYLWSNNSTSSSITGLTAGTYTVTITDANGCTTAKTVTITQPTQLVVTDSTITNVNCYGGSTGSLTEKATGGVPPYTWSKDGINFQPNSTFNSLTAGAYTISCKDASGYVATKSVIITQPSSALSASVSSQTNILCYWQSTGSVTLSATGGTGSYIWSKDGINFQSSSTFSSLAAGTFTVTTKDSNGCIATIGVTITRPSAPFLSSVSSQTNVNCYGTSTGIITMSGSGGVSPYTWSKDGINFQSSSTFSGLSAGSYTIKGKDANGCIETKLVTITQPTVLSVISNVTNVTTFGGNNGNASVNVSGGTSPYTYLWITSATTSSIINLTAGVYSVTITDNNSCSVSAELSISEPANSCSGYRTQTQGGWGASPSGNNPGTYLHTNFASAFPTGLTIGCTNKLTLTTAQQITDFLPSGSTPSILPSGTLTNPGSTYSNVLAGQLVALTLNTGFDQYDTNFSASSSLLKNTKINSGIFYGWTVQQLLDEANKKIGGCTSSYTLSQLNDALTRVNQNFDNGSVTGNFLACGSSINAIANAGFVNGFTGGTAVINVLNNDLLNGLPVDSFAITLSFISSSNSGITLNNKSVLVSSGTPAGNYLLIYRICDILFPTVCDEDTVKVTVNVPVINAVTDAGTVNGFNGGTAVNNVLSNDLLNGATVDSTKVNLTFVSSGNSGITLNGKSVLVATGTPAGNYILIYKICEILNPANCDQDTVKITVNAPAINAVADSGGTSGVNGGIAVSNVLNNDLLNGSPVDTSFINLSFVSSENSGITLSGKSVVVASGTPAGAYILIYKICEILNPTNCDQDTVKVNVTPCIGVMSISFTTIPSCFGIQTGKVTATSAGGVSPYTYVWNNTRSGSSIDSLAPGTYSVIATDSSGCAASDSVSINQSPQLQLSIIKVSEVTCLDNTSGAFSSSVSGGTSPYTYLWSNSATTPGIQSIGAGNYSLTVTDANGCVITADTNIAVQRITINSVKSGNWSDPTTWDAGRVPTVCDDVHIGNTDSVVIIPGIHAYCRDILCDSNSRFYIYDTLECRDFVTNDPGHITKVYGKLKVCSMKLDNQSQVFACSNISISNCTYKTNPLDIINGASLNPLGSPYCEKVNLILKLDSINIDLRNLCSSNIGIQTLEITNSMVTLDSCNHIVDYIKLNTGGDCNGSTPTWTGVSKLAINRNYNLNTSSILWIAGTGNVPHNIDVLGGIVNILSPKTVVTRMQIVGGIVTGGTNLIFANNSYLFRCGGILASPASMGTNVTVEMCSDTNSNNPPAIIGSTDMPPGGFTGDVIISTRTDLGGNLVIPAGRLIVTSTGTLNDSTFKVNQATAVVVQSGGVIITSNPNGLWGTGSMTGSIPLTLDPHSTTIYSSDSGVQTVSGVSYGTLILQDSAAKTFAGATNIAGDFIVSGGTTTTATNSIVTFNGNGNQNLAGLIYNDVVFSGTGTKTLTSPATVNSSLMVISPGVVLNTNNQLTLESNATTTAQVGPLLNGADIVGIVCWKRWIPGGSKNRRWRFLSNPVLNATFRWWQNDIFITGPGSNGVACDFNTTSNSSMVQNSNSFDQNQSLLVNPTNTSAMTCFTWSEPTGTWATIPRTTDTINPLVAYRTFVRGDRNIEGCLLMTNMPDSVSGVTLRSCGPIVKFTQTAHLTKTTGTGGGWNYVSNPYPCSINWADSLWMSVRSTSINPTLYIFNPATNQYTTWNPITGGTNGGTNIIGTGQSFFINTSTNTDLVFQETYKLDSGQIGFFGKKSSSMIYSNKLNIFLQGTDVSDEATIYLHEGATLNIENPYDALKMGYTSGSIASSTRLNDSKLVINAIAPVQHIDTILLSTFISKTGETYSLKFTGIEDFNSEYVILLRDKYLNTLTDISETKSYVFRTIEGVADSYDQSRFEIIIINSTTLPVTLSQFNAKKQNDKTVLVSWTTATEISNSHFIVEHSVDGINFSEIGLVKGSGNSNVSKNYSFLHLTPVNGLNYYRLTQIDINSDKKSRSYVVTVNITEQLTGVIKLFPVPANNVLNLNFSNTQFNGNATVKIFDITGRVLSENSTSISNSEQIYSLNVSNLSKGSYFVSVTSNGSEQVLKFIKD